MALAAAIQWEVRPASGTADAGGGFKAGATGTDRSQQNAVFTAFTDLVIGNPTTTQLTSAANPFGATDVGNVIAITGGVGFTTGFYEVVSVAGTTATMDRSVGTAGSTGGTGNLGGARNGFSTGTTTLQASLVAGQKAWVKNEAWNEAVSLTVAGTAANPIVVEGYNTTRGDAPLEATRPANDRAAAAGAAVTISGNANILKYLIAKSAGGAGFSFGVALPVFVACRATANGTDGFLFTTGTAVLVGCESDLNTAKGINYTTGTLFISGSYIHDNTTNGISPTGGTGVFVGSLTIVEANAATGLSFAAGTIGQYGVNLTVDGNTGGTSDGLTISSPVARTLYLGCIFSNNGRYGANATAGNAAWFDYCNYDSNVTAARNNVPTGPNDQALASQFTDRAGGNFAIGTNLKALGFPGTFPGALSVGYSDIGAVQRQEPAAGGGLARIIGG